MRMGKVIYSEAISFWLELSEKSCSSFFSFAVDFDHFQILRAIGKGAFGKVNLILSGDDF